MILWFGRRQSINDDFSGGTAVACQTGSKNSIEDALIWPRACADGCIPMRSASAASAICAGACAVPVDHRGLHRADAGHCAGEAWRNDPADSSWRVASPDVGNVFLEVSLNATRAVCAQPRTISATAAPVPGRSADRSTSQPLGRRPKMDA